MADTRWTIVGVTSEAYVGCRRPLSEFSTFHKYTKIRLINAFNWPFNSLKCLPGGWVKTGTLLFRMASRL